MEGNKKQNKDDYYLNNVAYELYIYEYTYIHYK